MRSRLSLNIPSEARADTAPYLVQWRLYHESWQARVHCQVIYATAKAEARSAVIQGLENQGYSAKHLRARVCDFVNGAAQGNWSGDK